MELYGRGYVIDHCTAQLQQETEEKAYRKYIADNLRLLGENVALLTRGYYYPGKWGEDPPKEDNRTADEIVEDVFKRAGLRLEGDE